MLCCTIPYGYIYYGETKHRTKVEFTNETREKVRKIFAEMHKYYEQRYTPKVKISKKCNACSLKDICLPVLNKKRSVSRYIDKIISEETRSNIAKRRENNIKTLFGLPYKQDIDGEDFVVLGVPYDTSVTNRTGCRFGPRAIRNAYGAGRLSYEQDNSYKVANLKGMDMGDIGVVLGYVEETMELIRESVRKVLDAGAVPIVLGGDHLIAYAELKAYSEKYGKVAMVHFDTHEDTWDYGDRIKYNHGTPFRNAIEDDILDTEHSIQVGIRSGGDTYRIKYAQDHGMKVITARELHKIGIKETCRRIKEQVGDAKVFITFDIDFLDPVYAPGTGTPMPGGFSTYEACEIIRNGLAGLDIVGFDLVEVMENYDPAGITAINAVAILKQFVILLSKKKAEQE